MVFRVTFFFSFVEQNIINEETLRNAIRRDGSRAKAAGWLGGFRKTSLAGRIPAGTFLPRFNTLGPGTTGFGRATACVDEFVLNVACGEGRVAVAGDGHAPKRRGWWIPTINASRFCSSNPFPAIVLSLYLM
jgi:hypothetical protein